MAAPSQVSPNHASEKTPSSETTKHNEPQQKSSPSNNNNNNNAAVDSGSTTMKKSPPSVPRPAASASASATPSSDLTYSYASTQASDVFLLAKQLLQRGDFDAALDTIATEMTRLSSSLLHVASSNSTGNGNGNHDEDEDIKDTVTFHPAMAPLYYLYGTTLLYSMEESTDVTGNSSMNMNMNMANTNTGTSTAAAAASVAVQQDDYNDDEQEQEQPADDGQVAWENLEMARHILQTVLLAALPLKDANNNNNDDDDEQKKETNDSSSLRLDLAQVHERLGDLSKANGRNEDAIADYQASLNIRLEILGKYDRKVATLYHALAVVYMLMASQGDATLQDQQDQQRQEGGTSSTIITPAQVEDYRQRSIVMYVECATSIVGHILTVIMTSDDAKEQDAHDDVRAKIDSTIANVVAVGNNNNNSITTTQQLAKGKTTGMDETELALCTAITQASTKVATLRQHVSDMWNNTTTAKRSSDPSSVSLSSSQAVTTPTMTTTTTTIVEECMQVLEEIQETIDEVETSREGMKQVSQLKADVVSAAHQTGASASAVASEGNIDGPTTTIGFGNATSSATLTTATSTTTTAAETSATSTTTTTKQPVVMVVKKKKKRSANEVSSASTASSHGDNQNDSSKRVKTNE